MNGSVSHSLTGDDGKRFSWPLIALAIGAFFTTPDGQCFCLAGSLRPLDTVS